MLILVLQPTTVFSEAVPISCRSISDFLILELSTNANVAWLCPSEVILINPSKCENT
jgi:hypothetical protein